MIWIDNIQDLQYYNTPDNAPCYCENLLYPSDLILQGSFNNASMNGFLMNIYTYSADGLTQLEEVTANFDFYFGVNPFNGYKFFNIRLRDFSAIMCAQQCFILRVVVVAAGLGVEVFDKFTERYCEAECCTPPNIISIAQSGLAPQHINVPPTFFSADPSGEPQVPITPPVRFVPKGNCGKALIRITATFPCYDNFLGEYYGIPEIITQGTASFGFTKTTNIEGRIKQQPREITREISFNCNLQRSESFRPWRVWSTELLPTWKMNEIESLFHAPSIIVDDFINERELQFSGGVIFTQIYKCWDLFKLDTILQECTVRQIFGCVNSCAGETAADYFTVPASYSGKGFYTQERAFIGPEKSDLINYFNAQDGVYKVDDLSATYPAAALVLSVQSTGYVPAAFFFDNILNRNKVYAAATPNVVKIACVVPNVGTLTYSQVICVTPDIGTLTYENQSEIFAEVIGYNTWNTTGSVFVSDCVARLTLHAVNPDYTYPDPIYFAGEIIGTIGGDGRPSIPVVLTSIDTDQIPVGYALAIDENGVIRWNGDAMSIDDSGSHIDLTDVYYNICQAQGTEPQPAIDLQGEINLLQYQIHQLQTQGNGIRITLTEDSTSYTDSAMVNRNILSIEFNGNSYNTTWDKPFSSNTITFNDLGPITEGTVLTINFA